MSHHNIQGARVVTVPLSDSFRARNGMEPGTAEENRAAIAIDETRMRERVRARQTKPAAPPAPAARDIATDPEIAKTVARITGALERDSAAAAAHQRKIEEAAEAVARAERASILQEAAALSSGPPQENPEIVIAQEATQYGAMVFRLLGETLPAAERVRHVSGLDYDEPLAQARHVRLDVALALENGVTVRPETMVARHRGARASHATDREQILALRTVFPECEALILREAANVERDYVDAFARVRAAAHRELVLATAVKLHATDAVRAAADLAHSKDVVRQARVLIDAATARGELLSAAEAVAQVTALEAQ